MSAESLERALLGSLVSGEVHQFPKPSWDDINTWAEEPRAHAVANLATTRFATIKMAVYNDQKNQKTTEIERVLHSLNELGWDGSTIDDFQRDINILKEELRIRLPEGEWEKYFE